jgi:hypothetical protein
VCLVLAGTVAVLSQDDGYLRWTGEQASQVAASAYKDGKVGSRTLLFWTGIDTRILKTERAQNYKLRATWFTPEVIRASARWAQLRSRLSDEETRGLVREAESAGDTVVVVDIDPNEGSGVIPPEWEAVLRPANASFESGQFVRGTPINALRKVRALQPIAQRNYDYDRFWVVFPLTTAEGKPLFPGDAATAELVVRIYNREGSVTWAIPPSVRDRALAAQPASR